MESPPLTPLHPFAPSKPGSPSQSRRPNSQRSSSFSSTHSFSVERRCSSYSNRRLSTSSRFSNGYDELPSPTEQRNRSVSGMGTLADELDSADEDDWGEGGSIMEEDGVFTPRESTPFELADPPQPDGSRDSGVDVGFKGTPNKLKSPRRKAGSINFSRPTSSRSVVTEPDFSPELEEAMGSISRLAASLSGPQADTTARTLSALRDLSNQSTLETLAHRLTTSTNSTASSLATHTKALQSATASILSPLTFAIPLSVEDIDELCQLLVSLSKVLPLPDTSVLQQSTKLSRDTSDLQSALSGLLDSLQMSKQVSTNAARALKVSTSMVEDLRREYDLADQGRYWIDSGGWDAKLASRWAAGECRSVMEGFEGVAGEVRRGMEAAGA
ncbi:hypothetical protein BDZ85DRAFT_89598 [Elsinoe ampelina]|uniref:Uncharacterized protein n=1 Tax=Elsinoe ampelina TaxID=302913 RepID=A0A6A6GHS1_9PEZI|nr:hypothetical protein BDZ85DRAFT_89598 [Elsinoe ampelina]